MRNLIYISASALLLSACGGATKKSAEHKGPDFVVYKQLHEDKTTNKSSCPLSKKSWALSNNKTLLDLSNSCLKAKNWKILAELGEDIALKMPESPWGAYYMSLASEGQGELHRALWMANLAAKKAPSLSMLHYHKGRIEWALGEGVAAIDSMKSAVKLDSNFVEANFFLANLYYQDQDYKSSLSYFKQVLKSKSSHSHALIGAGECSLKLDSTSDAQAYFEKALDQVPANISLRLKLADLYESNQKYEQALHQYRKARDYSKASRGPATQQMNDLPLKIRELEKEVAKIEKKKVSQSNSEKQGGA